MSKPPYTCPRCDYTAAQKNDMRRHLNSKRECPQFKMVVELTDEVKEFILKNRIYKPPVSPIASNITQIIQYNQVNNYVNQLNIKEKAEAVLEHRGIPPLCVFKKIEGELKREHKFMERKGIDFYLDDLESFADIVERVCVCQTLSEISVLYTPKTDQLHIFGDKSWNSMPIKEGTVRVMSLLNDIFFYHYERYLILQMMHHDASNPIRKTFIMEKLGKLYNILVTFDLLPLVNEEATSHNDSNSTTYVEVEEYKKVARNLDRKEKAIIFNRMVETVKKCNKTILCQLNNAVIEILECDPNFVKKIRQY